MRLIRLKEVMQTTGLARSTVYKFMKTGQFPQAVHLSARSVGWLESEVLNWISARLDRRLGGSTGQCNVLTIEKLKECKK